MFSATTMASSTTSPIATVIASKVMILKVKSSKLKTMSAPEIDTGIASTTASTEPSRPVKSSTIKDTASVAKTISLRVSSTLAATNTDESPTISVR